MTPFKKVNPKQSFPKLEEEILNFWDEEKIFEESIENRKEDEEFAFFDGPPFATGTPHYGHILAGTIKDVVPRYQTMKGKKVERKFGWDTHGLPIENIVEKKLGISGKEQIEEVGIFKFNEICRENVLTYVEEWRKTVKRMGRWVDMDNDYKTMDVSFMESVWWVFKTIYEKGLIYEGNRVVPYCPRCSTPLANFEVNQGYKDKQDKSITVKFKMLPDGIEWEDKEKQELNKYFLAWTTTPWTLMSNLGLAVGEDVEYSEIKDLKTGEIYILATDRLNDYYKSDEEYEFITSYKGTRLEGMKYEPIFTDFWEQLSCPPSMRGEARNEQGEVIADSGTPPIIPLIEGGGTASSGGQGKRKSSDNYLGENAYTVVLGHHVDTSTGTGIVHIAPAYGEDDFIIGKKGDLGFVQHIDGVGKTINTLKDNGKYVFDYNEEVISDLKGRGIIVKISTIDHSYPHCRRCNTPLIYRGISAWYVAVEKFRDQMVANNQKITWVPETIKDGRFGKWLEQARDWNISRNRYWGSAIPVWQSEDKKEEVCIGSIEELYELNKEFGQIEKRFQQTDTPILNSFSPVKGKDETTNGTSYKYFYTKYNQEIDLHKHFVDEILVKHPKTGTTLKRVPEVLDCWFESGSMPYASKHYPFSENFQYSSSENLLKKSSDILSFKPADFIAEGLDQTRGWFYTLLILSTALFDNTSFSNVIVNGIVLAEDGKKMSKSLQNYPDPQLIFDNYGADAMRFYLMNSPVVEAQDFRFAESGVDEVVKKVILPLWNTYYFFVTYANIDRFTPRHSDENQNHKNIEYEVLQHKPRHSDENQNHKNVKNNLMILNQVQDDDLKTKNNLDKWLVSELNELIKEVSTGFDNYKLDDATKPIIKFMDNLTNWYVRRSRKRFWKSENDSDKIEAYETLYYVLVELTKVIAPFMPFISEYIFKELTGKKSVHLEDYPKYNPKLIDEKLNADTDKTQKIISLGLAWRANNKIRVRQPLNSITITEKIEKYYEEIIKEELNVKKVLVVKGEVLAKKICKPNGRTIGPKFGSNVKFIMEQAKAGNFEELENGSVRIVNSHPNPLPKDKLEEETDFILEVGDFEIEYIASDSNAKIEVGFGIVIAMDDTITRELKLEGYARDIIRHIQEARKKAGYEVDDRIQAEINGVPDDIIPFKKYVETETLSTIVDKLEKFDLEKEVEIEELKVNIKLKK